MNIHPISLKIWDTLTIKTALILARDHVEQTVYEYKKILSRPTPVYPHNFWGRSPRRNERLYNDNCWSWRTPLCNVNMFLVLIYTPNKLTCMLVTVQYSTVLILPYSFPLNFVQTLLRTEIIHFINNEHTSYLTKNAQHIFTFSIDNQI